MQLYGHMNNDTCIGTMYNIRFCTEWKGKVYEHKSMWNGNSNRLNEMEGF